MAFPNDPYPTTPQSWATKIVRLDDTIAKRSISGKLYTRQFYTSPKHDFEVQHENMSTATKDALETYYGLYKLLPFTFVLQSDSVSRTCRFAGPPQYNMVPGGTWNASVLLKEA